MNIVTEAERSEPSTTDDLGAETIATNCHKQSATAHFSEVEQSEPSPTNDLGAETIATNSCKQRATDHFC